MSTSIVTVKGQVVIPAKLRHKYGIKKGTRVFFQDRDGEISLIPVTAAVIDENIGFLNTKGKLLRALQAEKEMERAL